MNNINSAVIVGLMTGYLLIKIGIHLAKVMPYELAGFVICIGMLSYLGDKISRGNIK